MPNTETALVHIPEVEKTRYLINSDNVYAFLTHGLNAKVADWRFAPELNLSLFTQSMERLANEYRIVHVLSDEQREKDRLSFPPSTNPDTESFYQRMKNSQDKLLDTEAAGERSSVIYLDHILDDHFQVTNPAFHEYARGEIVTADLYLSGKIPVVEEHTHPKDSLLSPPDYSRLLIKGYNNGRRVVNGLILVCPNVQILAVPTPQTPLLLLEEIDEFMQASQERSETPENPHVNMDALKEITEQAVATINNLAITSFQQNMRSVVELEQKIKAGLITENEARFQIEILFGRSEREQDKIVKNITTEQADQLTMFWTGFNRYNNTLMNETARSLNVVLFSSTNMKDFKQFSA